MNLGFSAGTVLPFASASVQLVYCEHMLEHLGRTGDVGATLLREVYRVLAPGGVLRLSTPDLRRYMCGYVKAGAGDTFLADHGKRFPPLWGAGGTRRRAFRISRFPSAPPRMRCFPSARMTARARRGS